MHIFFPRSDSSTPSPSLQHLPVSSTPSPSLQHLPVSSTPSPSLQHLPSNLLSPRLLVLPRRVFFLPACAAPYKEREDCGPNTLVLPPPQALPPQQYNPPAHDGVQTAEQYQPLVPPMSATVGTIATVHPEQTAQYGPPSSHYNAAQQGHYRVQPPVQQGARPVAQSVPVPNSAESLGSAAAGAARAPDDPHERRRLLQQIHYVDNRIVELRRVCKQERDAKAMLLEDLRRKMTLLEKSLLECSELVVSSGSAAAGGGGGENAYGARNSPNKSPPVIVGPRQGGAAGMSSYVVRISMLSSAHVRAVQRNSWVRLTARIVWGGVGCQRVGRGGLA